MVLVKTFRDIAVPKTIALGAPSGTDNYIWMRMREKRAISGRRRSFTGLNMHGFDFLNHLLVLFYFVANVSVFDFLKVLVCAVRGVCLLVSARISLQFL